MNKKFNASLSFGKKKKKPFTASCGYEVPAGANSTHPIVIYSRLSVSPTRLRLLHQPHGTHGSHLNTGGGGSHGARPTLGLPSAPLPSP